MIFPLSLSKLILNLYIVILLHELINWNQGVWHDREFFQPESEEEIKEIKKPKSYSTTIGRNYVLVGQTPPAISKNVSLLLIMI